MALNYIAVKVKSREEIESTLKNIDEVDNKIYATYGGVNIDILPSIWDVCGKEINVLNTARQGHGFDYSYLYRTPNGNGGREYIYLMKEWTTLVTKEY